MKEVLFERDYERFNFRATLSRKSRKSYSIFVSENYDLKKYGYHLFFRDLKSGLKVLHEDASKRTGENRENKKIYFLNNKKRDLKKVLEDVLYRFQDYRNFQNIAPYVYFIKSALNEFERNGWGLAWEW